MQKIEAQLRVIKVNHIDSNVFEGRTYKKRLLFLRDTDDAAYPEDYEVEFVSEEKMNQLEELGPNDIINVHFLIRGKHTAKPGQAERVWMRLHGLRWEIVHKAHQSAGTMQAATSAGVQAPAPQQAVQQPPVNEQQLNQPAGFTGGAAQPADDLPF